MSVFMTVDSSKWNRFEERKNSEVLIKKINKKSFLLSPLPTVELLTLHFKNW